MSGEYQALADSTLGSGLQGLIKTLQNAEDGLMSGDDGVLTDGAGIGRWPTLTGLDTSALTALDTYLEVTFLPMLRAAIARRTVSVAPADINASYGG